MCVDFLGLPSTICSQISGVCSQAIKKRMEMLFKSLLLPVDWKIAANWVIMVSSSGIKGRKCP